MTNIIDFKKRGSKKESDTPDTPPSIEGHVPNRYDVRTALGGEDLEYLFFARARVNPMGVDMAYVFMDDFIVPEAIRAISTMTSASMDLPPKTPKVLISRTVRYRLVDKVVPGLYAFRLRRAASRLRKTVLNSISEVARHADTLKNYATTISSLK